MNHDPVPASHARRLPMSVVGLAAFLLPLGNTTTAHASCGATFCTLMTDRYAQGIAEAHEGLSVDLRLEALTQDQLRSGTADVDPGQVADEEAVEHYTRNRNLVTTLGYGIDEHWSVALRVPVVDRNHVHDLVAEHTGLPSVEQRWEFTRLGDVQFTGRRRFGRLGAPGSFALFGGLKLPTGAFDVASSDGSRAERSLQPGSGTTDLVLGAAGRRALGLRDALIGEASLSQALASRDDYKPGRRVDLSAGWSYAISPRVGTVLQLNLRQRERDSGEQAEPDDSGSTTLDLSPGITIGAASGSTFYAYLQLPLYQDVNGTQLVPDYAFAVGWTHDF
jgi:hypothetical protein